MADLTVGAWRNGITSLTQSMVASVEKREKAGFRLIPMEMAILELRNLLDGYDIMAQELLGDEADKTEEEKVAPKRKKAA